MASTNGNPTETEALRCRAIRDRSRGEFLTALVHIPEHPVSAWGSRSLKISPNSLSHNSLHHLVQLAVGGDPSYSVLDPLFRLLSAGLLRLNNPHGKCNFVGILVPQSVDGEVEYLALGYSQARNVKTLRPPFGQLASCQGRLHLIH